MKPIERQRWLVLIAGTAVALLLPWIGEAEPRPDENTTPQLEAPAWLGITSPRRIDYELFIYRPWQETCWPKQRPSPGNDQTCDKQTHISFGWCSRSEDEALRNAGFGGLDACPPTSTTGACGRCGNTTGVCGRANAMLNVMAYRQQELYCAYTELHCIYHCFRSESVG